MQFSVKPLFNPNTTKREKKVTRNRRTHVQDLGFGVAVGSRSPGCSESAALCSCPLWRLEAACQQHSGYSLDLAGS